jgi:hypothetical protein
MDGKRFDELTQRLALVRFTRGDALRGMAASALTLAGITQGAETGMAQVTDEARRPRRPRRRVRYRYCRCDGPDDNCSNETGTKRQRQQHVNQSPCSYKGPCKGSGNQNPCEDAGVSIIVDINLLNILCPLGNECDPSGVTGLICLNGRCRPEDCQDTVKVCGPINNLQCCVADATCVRGLCVLPISSL